VLGNFSIWYSVAKNAVVKMSLPEYKYSSECDEGNEKQTTYSASMAILYSSRNRKFVAVRLYEATTMGDRVWKRRSVIQ